MAGEEQSGRLPRAAGALFKRFTELPDAEQLASYQAIHEYLSGRNVEVKIDRQLEAQAGAVEAIRRVVEHLRLDDVTQLTVKAFDAAPDEIREGWTVARVIKAHGTWRAAREVAAGERAVGTARQQSVRRGRGSWKLRSDDYFASVERWLATDPPKTGTLDYNQWAREWNATRSEGDLRVPGYRAVAVALGLRWEVVLAVARGEMTRAEAQEGTTNKRADGGSGLFVSTTDIAAITGRSGEVVRALSHREEFPTPVLLYSGKRYWLRADVAAHLAGETVPPRKLHELNGLYVGKRDAAKILGISHHSVAVLKGCPEPSYRAGRTLWLKSDIEAWRDQRVRDDIGRGHWKRKKP